METLSYAELKASNYKGYVLAPGAPEKVLQFGEGNFLRAFVDRFFDLANERADFNGKVVMVQPLSGSFDFADALNAQDCLYTVHIRGNRSGVVEDTYRVISACSRVLNPYREADYQAMLEVACLPDLEIIVSNTTEAGIHYDASVKLEDEPPQSFPGKLTQVLYRRFEAGRKGVIVLSCELIDHNGAELLRICKQHARDWALDEAFIDYLEHECTFSTTLVDTIVPGRVRTPEDIAALDTMRGFKDPFADVREPFEMWGIEGDRELESKLPFKAAGLDESVFVVDDVTPYKKRKVRILNGAHTAFVPGVHLAGYDIVRDAMHDTYIRTFMSALLEQEVIPTLATDLDRADLEAFADAAANRFDNPFIDHQLLSICLNSTSKWAARDLPSLLEYVEKNYTLPACLATSLALLIAYYVPAPKDTRSYTPQLLDGKLQLKRSSGDVYEAQDDASVLAFYVEHADDSAQDLVHAVLTNTDFWRRDLSQLRGLEAYVVQALELIWNKGALTAMKAASEMSK